MSKKQREQLQLRKQQLLIDIDMQRQQLGAISQTWLDKTQRIDSGWTFLSRIPKAAYVSAGLVTLLMMRRNPVKITRLSRHALQWWGTLRFLNKII